MMKGLGCFVLLLALSPCILAAVCPQYCIASADYVICESPSPAKKMKLAVSCAVVLLLVSYQCELVPACPQYCLSDADYVICNSPVPAKYPVSCGNCCFARSAVGSSKDCSIHFTDGRLQACGF
ncbi:hypothetical protein SELMODRAFT_442894 [Selaginella moellendorffii]|uniref:Uncharacterized protein n=1 Tax=Selaginella moellendorffii TaxID=88036 RepID=D8RWY6_SELML|nr:hypothetical protein SELMODRAFT_442894 [Selaginella moellendorffii]